MSGPLYKKQFWYKLLRAPSKQGRVWWLRVFLFCTMLFMLLASVAWVIFVRTFNAQHLSELLCAELQKRLGRPVAVSSLDLAFLNTVELKGFYVVDTEGVPGSALLAADTVMLHFKLLPLLKQQLVIDEVVLKAPRFNVVRFARGYNIPHIQTAEKPVYTHQGSGRKFTVRVENWTVENGVLSYQDLTSGFTHAVYGLNLHFKNLHFSELSPFTMELVLRRQWENGIADVEIEGAGQVNFANFHWADFALRNLQLKLFLFRQPVELALDLDNLRTPSFNLRADIPAFESKHLSVFNLEKYNFSVPKTRLALQGELTKNYQLLTLGSLTASAADVKLEGKGQLDFSASPFTASVQLDSNLFKLDGKEDYYPALASYKLGGKASAEVEVRRAGGAYQLPLAVLKTQNVSAQVHGFGVDHLTAQLQAKNNFTDLYGAGQCGKLTVQNSVFEKLDFSALWRKGNLYAYIAGAELNGEPIKISTEVNNLKSPARKIRSSLYFKKFDPMAFIATVRDFVEVIAPLVPGGAHFKPAVDGDLAWLRNFRDRLPHFMSNFSGTVVADSLSSQVLSGSQFNGEFELTGLQAGMKELSGKIEARLQGGVIHQMEKLAEEQRALNVTFQPFIIMHRMERAGSFKVGKVLKDVPFTDMAAAVSFENGRMQIHNAYTVGPSISAAVSGWTDWVNENFDIIIWTMFSNTSRSGALAENLTDESGNPALAFRVSSSMLKPKLEMQRAKKTGATIRAAQAKGLQTDFKTGQDFVKGDFHAKK